MTPEQEALFWLVRTLERLGIPHMVTGSVASSYHGRPRSTHDADVVIDPAPEQLDALVRSLLDAGFYVDGERARDALRRRLQFNAIETGGRASLASSDCGGRSTATAADGHVERVTSLERLT